MSLWEKKYPYSLLSVVFPGFVKISKTKIILEAKIIQEKLSGFFFHIFSQFFSVYPVLFLPQAKAKRKQKRHLPF